MAAAAPGFSSASVDLREGHLRSGPVAARFGLDLPASAVLTSLAIHVNDLLPNPMATTGTARMLIEDVVAGAWRVPELSLAAWTENPVPRKRPCAVTEAPAASHSPARLNSGTRQAPATTSLSLIHISEPTRPY